MIEILCFRVRSIARTIKTFGSASSSCLFFSCFLLSAAFLNGLLFVFENIFGVYSAVHREHGSVLMLVRGVSLTVDADYSHACWAVQNGIRHLRFLMTFRLACHPFLVFLVSIWVVEELIVAQLSSIAGWLLFIGGVEIIFVVMCFGVSWLCLTGGGDVVWGGQI